LLPAQVVRRRPSTDGFYLLEEAVRWQAALDELLLQAISGENAEVFRKNNGYLAAGIQTLIWESEDRLEQAQDQVNKERAN
jgi:hypothetical protein